MAVSKINTVKELINENPQGQENGSKGKTSVTGSWEGNHLNWDSCRMGFHTVKQLSRKKFSDSSTEAHGGHTTFFQRGQAPLRTANSVWPHHLYGTDFEGYEMAKIEEVVVFVLWFQSPWSLINMWQGQEACENTLRSHGMTLWRWRPCCSGNPSALEVVEPLICPPMKAKATEWRWPKEEAVCATGSRSGMKEILKPLELRKFQ